MKNERSLKQRSLFGFLWKLLEKVGTQAVSMIVQIVLARMLLPEDYGIIGYLTLFTTLADVFMQQGFTTALIQKKDADEKDFSSVFYANIALSVLLYGVFYLIAPFVAQFYHEPRLTVTMRVLCLNVVVGAISAVHNAIMAKNLEFKKSFIRGLSNIVTYGVTGIILAYAGFGVWALVCSKLAGLAVGAVVLWITVKWRPKAQFSLKRIRELFSYSSRVLGTNLLNTLFNNINPLIIGRYYTSADLGFYQRGQSIPQTLMISVDGSMNEVMYPTFAQLQNDLSALKSALRRSIKLSTYVVFPCLMGLLAVTEPLTVFLLTEKWLPSVPFMQLTCIICMFWPFSARVHALNAIGKSKLTFKMSLMMKAVSLMCLLVSARFGVKAIMMGNIVSSVISFIITSYYINDLLGYTFKELLTDVLPQLLLSLTVAAIVLVIGMLNINLISLLFIQVCAGITVYILGSIIFRLDSFHYVLNVLKGLKNRG